MIGGGRSTVKQALLQLEALVWMTRPSAIVNGVLVIPGWLAAASPPSEWRLAAMVGAVMVGRMIVNVVNDILDEEKDRVTAPHLPLPQGLITLPQAALTAGFLLICLLVLLALAGNDLHGFLIGAGGIATGGALIGCYSFLKPFPFASMQITAGAFTIAPLTGWGVAGGGWSLEIAAVLLYAFLRGLSSNVLAALRDVDLDGEVGNYSVAVRLGPRRSLDLILIIDALATMCVLGVAASRQRPLFGIVTVIVSLLLLGVGYLLTVQRQQTARGRQQRIAALVPLNLARPHIAIILIQSVSVAIAATVITVACAAIEALPTYHRRIVQGQLRTSLDAGRAEPSG